MSFVKRSQTISVEALSGTVGLPLTLKATGYSGSGAITFAVVSGGTANLADVCNVTGTSTFSGGTANVTGAFNFTNALVISGGTLNLSGTGVVTPPTLTISGGTPITSAAVRV